jgi:predicted metalloendopeptidase
MNRRCPCAFAIGLLLVAIGRLVPAQDMPAEAPMRSGIDTQYFDHGVRPQDNFYQYVNGKWLANVEIPADRPAYGAASKLYDDVQKKLAEILESTSATANFGSVDSDEGKIRALYSSFLDEARIERLGTQPLAAELARITAVRSKTQLPELVAHLQKIGVTVPFSIAVHPDAKDTTRYAADLQQDGLGLPDRDYYIKNDATTLRLIVREYQQHIQTVLALLGDRDAAGEAAAIVSLEARLARLQWDKLDSADPRKTYNPVSAEQLESMAPGFDWRRYLAAVGIDRSASYLIGSEPGYLHGFGQLIAEVPLSAWKAYFRWHLLSDFSPYLSKPYVDAAFAFFGTTLQGIPQNQSRQRRGLLLVDQYMGQALGRLYVNRNFSAASKARAEQLVGNLLGAFRVEIGTVGWMEAATKQQALLKLSRITVKIGYPNRWRDYSALKIQSTDLVGNVMRAASFEFDRRLSKLGRPIDRADWDSTPHAVNASYNPQDNEIVFPAAILQPPFFDADVDDAANYGGIGMVIGHELSHAFDSQGSQYDGDGKLRDWWTADDHSRFDALTQPLIDEYDHFMPLRGRQINGRRTLNENIADNAGLAIALKAYHLSLNQRPAPVIDGLTGDQRFFMGFAQAWREKLRDSFAVEMIESDPHAISYVRVLGTLINQTAFDDTFDVEQGDEMYLPPERRVVIW